MRAYVWLYLRLPIYRHPIGYTVIPAKAGIWLMSLQYYYNTSLNSGREYQGGSCFRRNDAGCICNVTSAKEVPAWKEMKERVSGNGSYNIHLT
jgi:hypothetical protein